MPHPPNRLAAEASAYLRQHAANPVDWYPWGDEAFEVARRLDRPILLSVGYSACHWCHVMERESFDDPAIAGAMNDLFVCIKVDREERPDIDHLYMKSLQAMTGRGGWPMTMFLTPDGRPFYAGTYFPPEDRRGMPGLPRVLEGVAKAWQERREEALRGAERVVESLEPPPADGAFAWSDRSLVEAAAGLQERMDEEHGGFGRAPKFPSASALALLMEAGRVAPDPGRRRLLELTLARMAAGGMRDHLGGGFHRYSVDRQWLVPHFEKMLYDQGILAILYSDAAVDLGVEAYGRVAVEVLEFVLAEMTDPGGTFHSSLDADSDGEEGRFYAWNRAEVLDVLGKAEGEAFCVAHGITGEPHFEGGGVLHLPDGLLPAADDWAGARSRLLARRALRTRPAADPKVVADWNSLVASALAVVGARCSRPDFLDAAERTLGALWPATGRARDLLHVAQGSTRPVPAFLDDYAFLGRALLDLFEARPSPAWLDRARACADELLDGFAAPHGGFYFARGDAGLVARTADLQDGSVPSGNSVAAELLFRLWSLEGEERYRRAADALLQRFGGEAVRYPYAAAHLLVVAERDRRGWPTVVIVGDGDSVAAMTQAAREAAPPGVAVLAAGSAGDWLPAAMAGKMAPREGARAYLCEGSTCGLPIEEAGLLKRALARRPGNRQEGS